MNKIVFKGCCTAMITPFNENGIDYENLKKQIEYQIASDTTALAFLGTTGENPTVSDGEYEKIAKFSKEIIGGRAKLILGTGSNNTARAIFKSQLAQKCGADGLLTVTPFYNKCTQNGLIKYYKEICDNVDLPVICYNVPSRTGVNILPETFGEIAENKKIGGIKEASGCISQICKLAKIIRNKTALYSGDDSLFFDLLSIGGHGVVSVVSNLLPKKVNTLYDFYVKGNVRKAKEIQGELQPVIDALFLEVNPIPVKRAMKMLGLDSGIVRPPLTTLEYANALKLKKTLLDFGCTIKE